MLSRTGMRRRAGALTVILGGLFCIGMSSAGRAAPVDVDLQLILAVDVSASMDLDELRVQREGYVAAISDPQIGTAIKSGFRGRIALAYVEWAGPAYQVVTMPWRVIDGAEAARRFADELAAKPILRETNTSISALLLRAATLFDDGAFRGGRRVIDVSGDGPNTTGALVAAVRDRVVSRGIVVNGLPLLLHPAPGNLADATDLVAYYEDCVTGGPGAFVLPVREMSNIAAGIRRKLILEIAGLPPRLVPAAAHTRPRADCSLGQKDFYE